MVGRQTSISRKLRSLSCPPGKRKASADFLCGALQLQAQQEVIEKPHNIIIGNLKTLESQHVKDLNEFSSALDIERVQELRKMTENIQHAAHLLKDLKKTVNVNNIATLDLEEMRAKLLALESKLAELREQNEVQYFQLGQQEKLLWNQVSEVADHIDAWSRPVRVEAPVLADRSRLVYVCGESHNDENVSKYQKFLLERGGHSGGWTDSDHGIYLKYRRKYLNKQTLLKQLLKVFPDKTLDEISEHDEWYADYENLRAKQKQAIASWRDRRSRSSTQPAAVSSASTNNISVPLDPKPRNKLVPGSLAYREQQREQLEKWKRLKQEEAVRKAVEEEESRKKALAEQERRQIKLALQKAEVKMYKVKKLKELQSVLMTQRVHDILEAEERAAYANKSLRVFRQRDAEAMARLQELKHMRGLQQRSRERVKEKLRRVVRVEAERDPHRLLRPTDAWREHVRDDHPPKAWAETYCNLNTVPHLAVPKWRKQNA